MGLISRVSSRTYRYLFFKFENIEKLNMVCVKDVEQGKFVTAFAAFLEKSGKVTVPKWSDYAKTSPVRQMGPANDNWFYVRMAAIARQLYCKGTLGVGTLSKIYGSSQNRGVRPSHYRKANGHIMRYALQELEKLKLVKIRKRQTSLF